MRECKCGGSMAGNPYDYDSYSQYYRPYNSNSSKSDGVAKQATKMAEPEAAASTATSTEKTAEKSDSGTTGKQDAADIIARLRAANANR